jgi:hypothetical protein
MKPKAIIIVLLCCAVSFLIAQPTITPTPYSPYEKVSVGLGVGIDLGGVGTNLIIYPQHPIGLFAGVGYTFVGVGANAGMKIRMTSADAWPKVIPYGLAMYGYNSVIIVRNNSRLNEQFSGVTIGVGLDIRPAPARRSFISLALLVPFRNNYEIDSYIDQNNINLDRNFLPIAFSFAFRTDLRKPNMIKD